MLTASGKPHLTQFKTFIITVQIIFKSTTNKIIQGEKSARVRQNLSKSKLKNKKKQNNKIATEQMAMANGKQKKHFVADSMHLFP